MSRSPRVSVGVPVYNGERYLAHALTRLLEQDLEDIEIIVSDNASTDATPEICRAFAAQDRRIRWVRNERNIGLAANHNRTFALSRAPLFKWAAHDDDFPPAMLSRLAAALDDGGPSVALVYSRCEYIDENGAVEGVDSDGVDCPDPRPHRRLTRLLQRVHMFNSAYGLIRADVLRRTRLHGLYPMSDNVILAELVMLGCFVELPEPLLRIRRHPGRSFNANRTAHALRELFNPGHRHPFPAIGMRAQMKAEIVRAAVLTPPRLRDKVLCSAVALAVPQWRTFRAYGGRKKQALRQALSSWWARRAAIGEAK